MQEHFKKLQSEADGSSKKNKEVIKERDYEWPSDDDVSIKRGNLIKSSLICLHLKDGLKQLTGLAFDSLDDDQSGSLDHMEIGKIMETVANSMGVQPANPDDL